MYTESTQMQSCLRCSPSNKQNLGAKRRGKPGAKSGAKNRSRHTAGPGGGPYCVRHSSVSAMSRPHCIVRNMSEGSDTTPCSSSYYMTASQPLGILHYDTHTRLTVGSAFRGLCLSTTRFMRFPLLLPSKDPHTDLFLGLNSTDIQFGMSTIEYIQASQTFNTHRHTRLNNERLPDCQLCQFLDQHRSPRPRTSTALINP